MNLISPRYFENIASGCMVMTEKNNKLNKLLPKNSYVEFSSNLSNFDEVLENSLLKFNNSKKKLFKNSAIIRKKHSWKTRAKIVLKVIKTLMR